MTLFQNESVQNFSSENEFDLHENELYTKHGSARTPFDTEAKENAEMAYFKTKEMLAISMNVDL